MTNDALLEPLQLGNLTLPNRLVMTAPYPRIEAKIRTNTPTTASSRANGLRAGPPRPRNQEIAQSTCNARNPTKIWR